MSGWGAHRASTTVTSLRASFPCPDRGRSYTSERAARAAARPLPNAKPSSRCTSCSGYHLVTDRSTS